MILYILLGIIAAALIALVIVLILRGMSDGRSGRESGSGGRPVARGGNPAQTRSTEFDDSQHGFKRGTDEYTLVLKDLRNSRSWRLGVSDHLIIGRGDDCDLALEDERVSRRHVLIKAGEDGLYIRNISEMNSLKLNGQIIDTEKRLKPGDSLRIGREELQVDTILSLSGAYPYEPERESAHQANSDQARTATKRFFT